MLKACKLWHSIASWAYCASHDPNCLCIWQTNLKPAACKVLMEWVQKNGPEKGQVMTSEELVSVIDSQTTLLSSVYLHVYMYNHQCPFFWPAYYIYLHYIWSKISAIKQDASEKLEELVGSISTTISSSVTTSESLTSTNQSQVSSQFWFCSIRLWFHDVSRWAATGICEKPSAAW